MARVLVIEDRPAIAMVFQVALGDEGHIVEALHNGEQGLNRLHSDPKPNLVIVDLNLPGISGKGIVEAMRANPRLQHIPVIIISGSVPSPDNLPPEGSFEQFISKPFDLDEVITAVAELTTDANDICA